MTVMRFKELDVVSLRAAHGELRAGAVGTVLEVFTKPEPAYLVEFDDEDGTTLATPIVKDADLNAWSEAGAKAG